MKDKIVNVESLKIEGNHDIVVSVFVSSKNSVPTVKTQIIESPCEEGAARVVVTTRAEVASIK